MIYDKKLPLDSGKYYRFAELKRVFSKNKKMKKFFVKPFKWDPNKYKWPVKKFSGFNDKGSVKTEEVFICRRDVGFPSKKMLRKTIEIIKYKKTLMLYNMFPVKQINFSSSPEWALFSRYSLWKGRESWDDWQRCIKNKLPYVIILYKMNFMVKEKKQFVLLVSVMIHCNQNKINI